MQFKSLCLTIMWMYLEHSGLKIMSIFNFQQWIWLEERKTMTRYRNLAHFKYWATYKIHVTVNNFQPYFVKCYNNSEELLCHYHTLILNQWDNIVLKNIDHNKNFKKLKTTHQLGPAVHYEILKKKKFIIRRYCILNRGHNILTKSF